MQELSFYWHQFWEFALGNPNLHELYKAGDITSFLSIGCTILMIWICFLRPIVRLISGKSRSRKIFRGKL